MRSMEPHGSLPAPKPAGDSGVGLIPRKASTRSGETNGASSDGVGCIAAPEKDPRPCEPS